MRSGNSWRRWMGRAAAAAGLALTAGPAAAQSGLPNGHYCPPNPCAPPGYTIPGLTAPAWPQATTAAPTPGAQAPAPTTPDFSTGPIAPDASSQALSGSTLAMAAPGYVDFAVPITQFRLRYDSAYGNNRPDRAEFFYAKCGCFRTAGLDPKAAGPPLLETNVDYQELRPYFEYAFSNRFSAFIETPVRFINPDQNANETGFGNLLAGAKYAMVACPDQYLTAQLLVSTPTADAFKGLGNELTALDAGVLWYRQLTDRVAFHGEVRDWIPLDGTDFAGNILRTGGALSYLAYNSCNFRISPIGEVVGWYVLDGGEVAVFNPGVPNGGLVPPLTPQVPAAIAVQDASGDTIVNAKIGVRIGFGPMVGPANLSRSDLYIGYGRALTGEVWYKDVFRVEYALRF